uniref:Uncharacterized protein n=1 Tax=Arundo donax TaxID=35708 RepID=A0A0A9B0C9_ARUDO
MCHLWLLHQKLICALQEVHLMVILMWTSHLLVERIVLERKSREAAMVMVCPLLLKRLLVAALRMWKWRKNMWMRKGQIKLLNLRLLRRLKFFLRKRRDLTTVQSKL